MFEFLLTFLLTCIVFSVYSWAQYDRPKKNTTLSASSEHNGNGNGQSANPSPQTQTQIRTENPTEKTRALINPEKNILKSSAAWENNRAIAPESPVRTLTSAVDLCIEWQSVSPQPISVPTAKRLEAKLARDRLEAEKLAATSATSVVVPSQLQTLEKNSRGEKNGNGSQYANGQQTNGYKNKPGSILPEDANLEADLVPPLSKGGLGGDNSEPATTTVETTKFDKTIINQALEDSRIAIGAKIHEFIGVKKEIPGSYEPLYDLLLDYPFRGGKMLRPTMCISTARAVGGMGPAAVSAATALELYHNAFLIHDDIEDGSEARRGKDTLHQMIGIPRAINVGDATNVLAVGLLLENLSVIGVTKTLNVLHEIEFMAQQSVEGQAMELDWVMENTGNLSDRDYFKMCVKKTCWYSFMTPCRIGLIVGHPSASPKDLVEPLAGITRFGMILGIAFQIQDDLLNLVGDMKAYGKEIGGDIYEGKRTLMLNHAIANSTVSDRDRMLNILATPRLHKTPDQVEFIMEQMQRYGSIEHGWAVARSLANKAAEILDSLDFLEPETPIRPGEKWNTPVHDRRFLKQLINYVIYRNL